MAADIPTSEVDWLLRELSTLDPLVLKLETFRQHPAIALRRSLSDLTALWQQRVESRIPVQYLVGTAPWRNFSLVVSPAVLIPRPETELLIDLAVRAVSQGQPELAQGHWVDLGTGSGAIALGLAEAFPQATLHATDVSPAALAIAQQNAERLGYASRIQFYLGEWFAPLSEFRHTLSGMVSNPPYIPSPLIPDLQPEVVRHEPHLALDGGADGLTAIRELVTQAPLYLKPDGIWLIEAMAGQAEAIASLLQQQDDYHRIQIHADLAGINRFILAYRKA